MMPCFNCSWMTPSYCRRRSGLVAAIEEDLLDSDGGYSCQAVVCVSLSKEVTPHTTHLWQQQCLGTHRRVLSQLPLFREIPSPKMTVVNSQDFSVHHTSERYQPWEHEWWALSISPAVGAGPDNTQPSSVSTETAWSLRSPTCLASGEFPVLVHSNQNVNINLRATVVGVCKVEIHEMTESVLA